MAGFVRYAMPYLDPGILSDEDAQHVSAFIISKPRPAYPYKHEDWQTDPMPIDAAFYRLGNDSAATPSTPQP
jgi:cytochrome c